MRWAKLDKYFSATDRAPVYLAVVVLNLKFKGRYFEVKWDRGCVQNGKQKLKRYWVQFVANTEEENGCNSTIHMRDQSPLQGNIRAG